VFAEGKIRREYQFFKSFYLIDLTLISHLKVVASNNAFSKLKTLDLHSATPRMEIETIVNRIAGIGG